MRQAHARKSFDAYLDAPKRSETAHLRVVEDLREEVPSVEIPDWAEPFSDPRWDDRLGEPPRTEPDGRRTVVVTGRPGAMHQPRRDRPAGATARMRRHTPTRARLAGRPDRVAMWAFALALIMAAMAGFTGSGHGHSSHGSGPPAPAPVFDR
jgi:hypothetical protein